jgi:hypothetical protein
VIVDLNGWLKGLAGGAFFLFLTWGFGVWLNYRVNRKVQLELKETNRLLRRLIRRL